MQEKNIENILEDNRNNCIQINLFEHEISREEILFIYLEIEV